MAWSYSLNEFAGITAVTGHVNRLITFGQAVISWDTEAPPFEKTRQSALQYLRHIVDADLAAAERTAQKQEEDAKRSQQAQPKYSEPYPAKGKGKGGSSSSSRALAPRERRPPELAIRHMARMDAPRDTTRTGADAGTGTIPATVGLSTDLLLALCQLSQSLRPMYVGFFAGLDFANPNLLEAFAFLTSPA